MQAVNSLSDLDLTKQYTYADYLLWTFADRVELIKGFIMKMSPAPNRFHQVVARNVTGVFLNIFKNHPCGVYFAPFDVRLPVASKKKNSTVVQPDLCVVCDRTKLDDAGCNGAPELMIEILSPSTSKYDLETKFNLYEEAGVLEYWIIEPVEKMILVYTLSNGKYIGLPPQVEGNNLKSVLFADLIININDIFEDN